MENPKFNKFLNEARKVSLTNRERALLWQRISGKRPVVSPYHGIFSYVSRTQIAVFAAVLMPLFFTVAAEGSLPGEILYPLKVKVSEEVILLTKISPVEEAKWEIRRVERRLEEVQRLAARGELTSETSAVVDAALESQIKRAEASVALVTSDNKDRVAVALSDDLTVALEVHEEVLENVAAAAPVSEEMKEETRKLANKVEVQAQNQREATEKKRETVSLQEPQEIPSAEELSQRVAIAFEKLENLPVEARLRMMVDENAVGGVEPTEEQLRILIAPDEAESDTEMNTMMMQDEGVTVEEDILEKNSEGFNEVPLAQDTKEVLLSVELEQTTVREILTELQNFLGQKELSEEDRHRVEELLLEAERRIRQREKVREATVKLDLPEAEATLEVEQQASLDQGNKQE